ncbi:YncE family protein [Silvibacterium dinghuense]|uniref:Uncharacterized protein n=1 Tax=Silvibacterium dinghuense TaxID=1560006 RepID=A0A4Q1SEM0_9BACT|nr:hypothetical protein [Silvibacterium dinghuense]RXS95378.1 hypothetical protein ESZ00_12415 [Silvibacterium dinghuense]GGH12791.1 hypothetical protein GCM10011586_32270 [Silvibacterium dinghuense]
MKWLAAASLLVLAGLTGCGSQYRPVINQVTGTGPASEPTAYAVVVSQPELTPPSSLATTKPPCPTTQYSDAGIVTLYDFSGDSVMAQAQLGTGPLGFAFNASGSDAYTLNCDNTMSTIPISQSLQTKNVLSSTFFSGAAPINALAASASEYVVEEARDAVAAYSGSPAALVQEVTVAPSVVNVTGINSGARIYAISQGNSSNSLAWGSCSDPSSVSTNGEADGIEVSTNTVSSQLQLGICPVYAVTSADGLRTFVLNRGSGTVTVINAQSNSLDTNSNSSYLGSTATINLCNTSNSTSGITASCGAQPVYAAFYTLGDLLVTANYGNNTMSVIDVSTDIYGNDSSTFGKIVGTISTGANPAALTILGDGSKVYSANEGDGTVTVGSLTSYTAQSTITLLGTATSNNTISDTAILQPRVIDSIYNYPSGRVYVGAPNSEYLNIIDTESDTITAYPAVEGQIVDLHTTTQYAGGTCTATSTTGAETYCNQILTSHSYGSGTP